MLDLEAMSGIGKTTIYRILDPKADYLLTLTTLIKLAAAYELPVWQFLYPHYDPAQRPVVLSPAEQDEHAHWHLVFLQVRALADGGRSDANNSRASGAGSGDPRGGPNPSAEPPPFKRQKYPRP